MTPRRSTRLALPGLALAATSAFVLGALAAAPAATAVVPADATLTVTGLAGTSKPGVARTGTVTLRSSGAPVAGETVTLTVDHGFFTTGAALPSTSGAQAGALTETGTTFTGTTDSTGTVTFQLGIARDSGFDDDGAVTAVVSARAGSAQGSADATWSSADPLNAGSVELVLSPRQETPVAPAVSGDRTFYDVVARDQFGNPVAGAPVYLDFKGQLQDYDYSDDFVDSDLDRDGDVWVVSFVPGDLLVTGSWERSSTVYDGTTGATKTGPALEKTGAATASFYDVDLTRSALTLAPSVPGDAAVGSAVTQTATVRDQRGNPVRGLEVSFFRFGPDASGGEQKVDRVTNARGQASYTFVGADPGTAKVTAVVTDGVDRRTLVSEVRFRHAVTATLSAGKKAAPDVDALTVKASKVAAGAKVSVFRVKGSGLKRIKVRGLELDEAGRAKVAVPDTNGRRKTTYVVTVDATPTTFAATTAALKVR